MHVESSCGASVDRVGRRHLQHHGGRGGNAAVPTATNVGTPVRATIDVPASAAVFAAEGGSVGGIVTRVELNQPGLRTGLSSWYRLAYVDGGTHLRMFENYFETIANPASDIVESQLAAWRFANELVGSPQAPLPDGASVRTGADFGSSAGLMFALTFLDLLSPGRLVGELRVAGTGGIGPDEGSSLSRTSKSRLPPRSSPIPMWSSRRDRPR